MIGSQNEGLDCFVASPPAMTNQVRSHLVQRVEAFVDNFTVLPVLDGDLIIFHRAPIRMIIIKVPFHHGDPVPDGDALHFGPSELGHLGEELLFALPVGVLPFCEDLIFVHHDTVLVVKFFKGFEELTLEDHAVHFVDFCL